MKAVGYVEQKAGLGVEGLVDLDLPVPEPGPHDLLVRVQAIAVNPRDIKMRGAQRASPENPRVLGWDAAGVVENMGSEVCGFTKGDHVLYAGNMLRAGANAEFHLVDARIAGRMPKTLDFSVAASLPLATLTAWEMLFDRLGVPRSGGDSKNLLILGGAGGVATMAVQLASRLTNTTVIASASRPESEHWVRKMGAHHVVSHRANFGEELKSQKLAPIHWAFSMRTSPEAFAAMTSVAAPYGRIGFIDEPEGIDINLLKPKSLSLHAEAVFTKTIFETEDIEQQRHVLEEVAQLVADGRLQSPVGACLGKINATGLRRAHQAIESGASIGKIVLEGF
jgi:NADPH2:quinone reductase